MRPIPFGFGLIAGGRGDIVLGLPVNGPAEGEIGSFLREIGLLDLVEAERGDLRAGSVQQSVFPALADDHGRKPGPELLNVVIGLIVQGRTVRADHPIDAVLPGEQQVCVCERQVFVVVRQMLVPKGLPEAPALFRIAADKAVLYLADGIGELGAFP